MESGYSEIHSSKTNIGMLSVFNQRRDCDNIPHVCVF